MQSFCCNLLDNLLQCENLQYEIRTHTISVMMWTNSHSSSILQKLARLCWAMQERLTPWLGKWRLCTKETVSQKMVWSKLMNRLGKSLGSPRGRRDSWQPIKMQSVLWEAGTSSETDTKPGLAWTELLTSPTRKHDSRCFIEMQSVSSKERESTESDKEDDPQQMAATFNAFVNCDREGYGGWYGQE